MCKEGFILYYYYYYLITSTVFILALSWVNACLKEIHHLNTLFVLWGPDSIQGAAAPAPNALGERLLATRS